MRESDICLTKRTRLYRLIWHSYLQIQKVSQSITHIIKIQLLCRQRMQESNGYIIVTLLKSTSHNSTHGRATWNHHSLTPIRHERRQINKLVSHGRRHCSSDWGFQKPRNMRSCRLMRNAKSSNSKLTKGSVGDALEQSLMERRARRWRRRLVDEL